MVWHHFLFSCYRLAPYGLVCHSRAEFVLETAVFFFRRKFFKGLRTLGNHGIDLCFICDKVAVFGRRRRRAWSSWVLALVDFIGAIKFTGFGYKVG